MADTSTLPPEYTPTNQRVPAEYPLQTPELAQYLYYQLFQSDQTIPSYYSSDTGNPAVGKILRISIAPPKTFGVFRRGIARLEGFEAPDALNVYLPESDNPVPEANRISFIPGAPGTLADDPLSIIIVFSAERKSHIPGVLSRNSPAPWTIDADGVGHPGRDPNDPNFVLSSAIPPKWRTATPDNAKTTSLYLFQWNPTSEQPLKLPIEISHTETVFVNPKVHQFLEVDGVVCSCVQIMHPGSRRIGAAVSNLIKF
ncbi:hypothetical protein DL93DRAFT_2159585 [Clavulina sp. PMI_390]|nr:hypothetical protein DL93DRAFT_2159585 [Clavulina sp. PMI_390]